MTDAQNVLEGVIGEGDIGDELIINTRDGAKTGLKTTDWKKKLCASIDCPRSRRLLALE